MPSEEVVLGLIGRIYDAASDPKLWPIFLEDFADIVGGTTTSVIVNDVKNRMGNLAVAVRMDPHWQHKYDEHYVGVDCWGANGMHLTTGDVVTGQMLCPDSLLQKSEFFNDFLRPMGAMHEFCGVIRKDQSVFTVISSLRPRRSGPFGEDEIRLLKTLMPHLQRAVQLHQRIATLESQAQWASDTFDRLAMGLIILGAGGKILIINQQAANIIKQNDGLKIASDSLSTERHAETKRLQQLIHGAAASASGKSLNSGGAMTISRPSVRRAFEILVVPLRLTTSWKGPDRASAAVFITDPETQPEAQQAVLSRLYDLTPAEARLAAAMMQGTSLEQIASEFGLARNTVRSQLQKIFQKTSVKRQAELVRLLWNSPARLQST